VHEDERLHLIERLFRWYFSRGAGLPLTPGGAGMVSQHLRFVRDPERAVLVVNVVTAAVQRSASQALRRFHVRYQHTHDQQLTDCKRPAAPCVTLATVL
jgi:hypothetical protein